MKRNRALLLKTAKRIEDIPQSYNQKTFCEKNDKVPCGTAGCLAGEIIIASERSVKAGVKKLNLAMKVASREGSSIDSKYWPGFVAARLAGLNDEEAETLFYNTNGYGWPAKFRNQFQKAKTHQGQARAAVRLLRYLADGGAV